MSLFSLPYRPLMCCPYFVRAVRSSIDQLDELIQHLIAIKYPLLRTSGHEFVLIVSST